MATTTKKATTKTVAKKPATARKTTAKQPAKKQKAVEVRSFRQSQNTTPFMTFKFTQQSVYWLILGVIVISLGSWVMYLDVQIQKIYDQVEINTYLLDSDTMPEKNKLPVTPAQ